MFHLRLLHLKAIWQFWNFGKTGFSEFPRVKIMKTKLCISLTQILPFLIPRSCLRIQYELKTAVHSVSWLSQPLYSAWKPCLLAREKWIQHSRLHLVNRTYVYHSAIDNRWGRITRLNIALLFHSMSCGDKQCRGFSSNLIGFINILEITKTRQRQI